LEELQEIYFSVGLIWFYFEFWKNEIRSAFGFSLKEPKDLLS